MDSASPGTTIGCAPGWQNSGDVFEGIDCAMTLLTDWKPEDRYTRHEGTQFLSGTQALAKLPLLQKILDEGAGLNTAGFVSGYRGSPLGNLDSALWAMSDQLKAKSIIFRPGVNEDLAATAVWGTQQANQYPMDPKYDGVFSIWYGKGPGVDRSGDVFKHGNIAGASRYGGVLLLVGDDHGGKSSSLLHQSDQALLAAAIPVLHPVDIADFLRLGLFGWAMSRATGLWAGMKCLTAIVDSSGTLEFSFADATFAAPGDLTDFRSMLPPEAAMNLLAEEEILYRYRLPAAKAFVRANPLDEAVIMPERKRLGIVAVGKAYGEVMQALADLGLSPERAAAAGIGIYVVRFCWPLETERLSTFAQGFDEILIVEEKRAFVEPQVKDALYHISADQRPLVSGKRTENGEPLLPETGELNPGIVRRALVARMARHGLPDDETRARAEILDKADGERTVQRTSVVRRIPAFCSGCPHNSSTKLPDGSIALAGIGCHALAMFLPDRPTLRSTHMGGEGVNWTGMAPFVRRQHVFQNLGDGTYFHSGLMAVRAAVASGVNITYKILFNDAVAMTGGQPIDGEQTVESIASQLMAEGVKRVVVVTEDMGRYHGRTLPADIVVHDRAELVRIEQELAKIPGTTALVYDQVCATEKRRRRKRGRLAPASKRVFINSAVCEGCGDCGAASNCVSLRPEPTPFGVKRAVDQTSCNGDYSCVNGFCPSFVTVEEAVLKAADVPAKVHADIASLAEPMLPELTGVHGILVTGVGGTGVVTVGALIAAAAHMAGRQVLVLDQTGLSQKNGAVASHIQIAADAGALHCSRIGVGGARVLIGCDLLVSAAPEAIQTLSRDAEVVLNTHVTPTVAFQQNRDMDLGGETAEAVVRQSTHYNGDGFDASVIAESVFGNAILSNIILLGTAWQKGMIPLPRDAMELAIRLNGVSVADNLAAFALGRQIAVAGVEGVVGVTRPKEPESGGDEEGAPDHVVQLQAEHLEDYQDADYAAGYRRFVADVAAVEQRVLEGSHRLTVAVARNLGKLMAYKDEYEVARLMSRPQFRAALNRQFEDGYRLRFNMAPPLLARRDPVTGHLRKREFGAWMMPVFTLLAKCRRLRGTLFDPFGWTTERRTERELVKSYRTDIEAVLSNLSPENMDAAVALADLPDVIRGYGHVKEAAIQRYFNERNALLSVSHGHGQRAAATVTEHL